MLVFRLLVWLSLINSGLAVAQTLQDPTRPRSIHPVEVTQVGADSSRLESIIIITGISRHAVIGGVTYHEGDRVGDSRIKRIESDKVILTNGEVMTLFPVLIENSDTHKGGTMRW